MFCQFFLKNAGETIDTINKKCFDEKSRAARKNVITEFFRRFSFRMALSGKTT
jgi:hypothetical protein